MLLALEILKQPVQQRISQQAASAWKICIYCAIVLFSHRSLDTLI